MPGSNCLGGNTWRNIDEEEFIRGIRVIRGQLSSRSDVAHRLDWAKLCGRSRHMVGSSAALPGKDRGLKRPVQILTGNNDEARNYPRARVIRGQTSAVLPHT